MIQAKAINHIGIAVKSIDACKDFYEKVLGARFEGVEVVADQKVKVAFFTLGTTGQEVRLELLEATDPASPVAQFIEKRGEGLHHLAYTVDNIQARIDALKAGGIRMIDDKPRPGAHHTQIAFMHPKSSASVLTEICEPKH
jgi:methylmalonyl-CoA/ethylmalonyl-CoA epimerase